MTDKKANIIESIILLISIAYMVIIIATSRYIQYSWDVRMDYIGIFSGTETISSQEVALQFLILAILTILSLIRWITISRSYQTLFGKFVFVIILLFGSMIVLVPAIATVLIIAPLIMIQFISMIVNLEMTFIVKIIFAILTLVVYATLLRLIWRTDE